MTPLNQPCCKISPFVNTLRTRYPSVNFLKVTDSVTWFIRYIVLNFADINTPFWSSLQVDVNESPAVARAENVRTIPTFKIYKNGVRVKEMICPSQQLLEYSVRHYGI
jgi:hypothetical protein